MPSYQLKPFWRSVRLDPQVNEYTGSRYLNSKPAYEHRQSAPV